MRLTSDGKAAVVRVAPVAVGEDAQPAGGKRLDLVLHGAEVGGRVLVPFGERAGQFGGFLGVGLEGVDDVHPVERVQVVEVDHVILHVLGGLHDVADQLGGRRNADAQRVFDGADAGLRVNRGAHAADALGDGPGIAGIAADEDLLEAAHHGAGAVGVGDDAVLHHRFNAQVAFNASDGIDNNSWHSSSRFLLIFGVDFGDDLLLADIGDKFYACAATPARVVRPTAVPMVSAVLSMPKPGNLDRC